MTEPPASEERRFGPAGLLVWGMAASQLVGWGTLYFAFSLFITPMEQELGWSRSDLNGAVSLGLLSAGIVSIPIGQWIDRHGGWEIMTAGAVLGAVLLALWSQIDNLVAFYAVWVLIGVATAATVQDVPFAVVTANVKDYRRAIAYLSILGGFSSTIFFPLTSFLIERLGWRHALLALAALQFIIPVTLNFVLLRGTRGSMSEESAALRAGGRWAGSPLRQVLARPAFWGLALAFSAQSLMFTGITFHGIPLMLERGVELGTVVLGLALLGPAQTIGRLVLLGFGPDVSARVAGRATVLLLPLAAGILLATRNHGVSGFILFVAVFGLGNGVLSIVRAAGIAEILGTRGYGAITGAMNVVLMIPRTAAPIALAALWQASGSYDAVVWLLIAATSLGAVAFWIASMERPPSE